MLVKSDEATVQIATCKFHTKEHVISGPQINYSIVCMVLALDIWNSYDLNSVIMKLKIECGNIMLNSPFHKVTYHNRLHFLLLNEAF